MSEYVTKEDFAAYTPVIKEVAVDCLGGKKFRMTALRSERVVEYLDVSRGFQGEVQTNMTARFVAAHLCDEKGEPLFSDLEEGRAALQKLPHEVLLVISETAAALTPLSPKQIEDRAKNSQEPPTKDS